MLFKKKEVLRKVPAKNYYIVIGVSLLVIALTLYVRSFYLNYQAKNTEDSIFYDKSINQINIDDLNFATNESTDAILFVSYNGDKIVSSMERRLYREINKKGVNDKVIYLNVTEKLSNDEYLNALRNRFPENAANINRAPMFIYIKNGVSVEVIDSKDRLADYRALNTLLLKYGIE